MLKRLAILALLLVLQAFVPLRGQTPARAGNGSGNADSNSQNKDGATGSIMAVVDQAQPPKDAEHTAEVGPQESEHRVTLTSIPPLTINVRKKTFLDYAYEWGPWFFGLFLAVAGGVQLRLLRVTWKAIQEQKAETAVQTGILKESVAAAQKSAAAADISANAAMGVAVPTLMLNGFAFASKPGCTANDFFTHPGVILIAKNFGQSPAFLKGYTITFTCDDLPDEPVYQFPYPCNAETVVDAGKTFLPDKDTLTLDKPMSDLDILALVNGKKFLTAYGYISYGDIFGSPIRYMKFSKRLMEFDPEPKNMLVMDHDGYKYTGQHESYDPPATHPSEKAN